MVKYNDKQKQVKINKTLNNKQAVFVIFTFCKNKYMNQFIYTKSKQRQLFLIFDFISKPFFI